MQDEIQPNAKQVDTIEEFNLVDMDTKWTYSEGLTRYFNKPTFKKRQRKR